MKKEIKATLLRRYENVVAFSKTKNVSVSPSAMWNSHIQCV